MNDLNKEWIVTIWESFDRLKGELEIIAEEERESIKNLSDPEVKTALSALYEILYYMDCMFYEFDTAAERPRTESHAGS